jgi:hypothetical protein
MLLPSIPRSITLIACGPLPAPWPFGGRDTSSELLSGLVLGVLPPIFHLVAWRPRQHRKELSYQILTDSPLVSSTERQELHRRLQILLDGRPTWDISVILLAVTNSGTSTIGVEDYAGPVEFDFGIAVEVLTAAIIKTAPNKFTATAAPAGTKALLHPVLLNPGDSVILKVLARPQQAVEDPISNYLYVFGRIKETEIKGP